MKKCLYHSAVLSCLLILGLCPATFAQFIEEIPLGIFTHQASYGNDWGMFDLNKYSNGTYEVLGSGSDIWDNSDNFMFVYKEITGSFIMSADLKWGDQDTPGGGPTAGNEWKKMGLMIREDSEANGSRHLFAMLRNDLQADFQGRNTVNGGSSEFPALVAKAADDIDTVQLIRSGSAFSMNRKKADGSWKPIGSTTIADFANTAYVGLAITSHDTNNLERAFFSNVTISQIKIGASVARSIPQQTIDTGQSVTGITLTITVEAGKTGDAKVTEKVPAGWTASNAKATKGTATIEADGSIVWNVPGATGSDAVLTYDVKSTSKVETGVFSGKLIIEGNEFIIGGNSAVNVLPPATSLGVFEKHEDIFNTEATLGAKGDARYDPATGTYIVLGSGHDIWDAQDDFHFLYVAAKGDCSIKANVQLDAGSSSSTWAKAGLMLRDEPTADSPHAFAMIRLTGRDYAPQWRDGWGAGGNWEGDAALVYGGTGAGQQSGTIGLEYTVADNMVKFYYWDAATNEKVMWRQMDSIDFADENYLGLCVTSHEAGSISKGTFTSLSMTYNGKTVGIDEWSLY